MASNKFWFEEEDTDLMIAEYTSEKREGEFASSLGQIMGLTIPKNRSMSIVCTYCEKWGDERLRVR